MQGDNSAIKAIGRIIFGIGLAALSVVLFVFSTLNAYSLFSLIFPTDTLRAMAGVLLIDAAFLVWLGVFVWLCDSTAQSAIAALAAFGTLLAVLAVNWISMNLTGQGLVSVDRAGWGMYALYSIEGVMTWHLIWTVAHFIANPGIVAHVNATFKTNVLLAKAQHKADESMDRVADELATQIADTRHVAALRELANQSGVSSLTAGGLTVTSKKAVSVQPASVQPVSASRPATSHSPNGQPTPNTTTFP